MFSDETRQHVLGLLDEGYSAADVADIIGCSGRSMLRWMRFFEENGTVWQDPRLRNLHADAAIRNPHLTRAVLTLVEKEPAAIYATTSTFWSPSAWTSPPATTAM